MSLKIPDNVSYEEAAAASMTLLTSWHMLIGRAKIKPGQIVLIMGGSSGVGIFGIQIAKLYGCTVIATASPDKLEKAQRTWRGLCCGSQKRRLAQRSKDNNKRDHWHSRN